MRYLLVILTLAVLISTGCKKDTCNRVTITHIDLAGTMCRGAWAIKKNTKTYEADSIPVQFQQEGLVVCAKYELWEDLRLCPCCLGTKAHIISMSSVTK